MGTAVSSLLALVPDATQRRMIEGIDPGAGMVIHLCASAVEADRIMHRIKPDVVVGGQAVGLAWLVQTRTRDPDAFRILWDKRLPLTEAIESINRGDADAILREPFDPANAVELFHHGCEQALLRRHTQSLVDELAVRNAELLGFNERLEDLVAERTQHLVEAQERLHESHRQMLQLETQATVTHLLRGLAHEFNNPLAAIFGYSQRLHRQATDPEVARRLSVILQEVEHCRLVVQQLSQLSTPLSEQAVRTDPAEAFRDGAKRYEATGGTLPEMVVKDLPPDVLSAPRALARVFEQIIANAVDAGATRVTLDGDNLVDRVRLLVANDGSTPDDTVVANAIRPFFTTRAGDNRRGLGLSTAAALMREQDGTIELARRDDGPGAVAIITLPAAEPPVRRHSSQLLPAIQLQNTGGLTQAPITLVIDDEPMVAEILVDALHDAGCTTAVAGSVAEGMAELTHLDVRALVVDLNLPDGNGLDLARRALALKPSLAGHIALTTGDGDRSHIDRLIAEHGFPVLAKPFRLDEVRALAEKIR
jgi:signal transduction histidine kinase/CheY-like chemotaxis protein